MKIPCKKGLIPIVFIFLIERFAPIKNKLIWSPFFPNSLIVANPLKSGNIEFRNIARRITWSMQTWRQIYIFT